MASTIILLTLIMVRLNLRSLQIFSPKPSIKDNPILKELRSFKTYSCKRSSWPSSNCSPKSTKTRVSHSWLSYSSMVREQFHPSRSTRVRLVLTLASQMQVHMDKESTLQTIRVILIHMHGQNNKEMVQQFSACSYALYWLEMLPCWRMEITVSDCHHSRILIEVRRTDTTAWWTLG